MSNIDITYKDGKIGIHSDDPNDAELIRDIMAKILMELGKKRKKKLVKGKDYIVTQDWVKP